MDQEPEKYLDAKSARSSALNIPPPDLTPPPPPPPSPLSNLPETSAVKVNLLKEDGGIEPPAKGIAPFGTRIAAAVIDSLVSSGIMIGLGLILPGFAHRLAWLTGIAYMVTRDSLPFLKGQSVGKKAMKLKAVTLEGKSLVNDWQAALVRNGVLIIPFFALVELVVLLTREDKPESGRRLGDEWAKTKVILDDKPVVTESAN